VICSLHGVGDDGAWAQAHMYCAYWPSSRFAQLTARDAVATCWDVAAVGLHTSMNQGGLDYDCRKCFLPRAHVSAGNQCHLLNSFT